MNNMLSLYIRYVTQGYLIKNEYLDKHLKPIGHYNPMDGISERNCFTAAEDIAECFFYSGKSYFGHLTLLLNDARNLFAGAVLYVHASNLPYSKKNLSSVRSLFTDKKIWKYKKVNLKNLKERVVFKMRDFKAGKGEEDVSQDLLDCIHKSARRFLLLTEIDMEDAVTILIRETQILEDTLVKEMTKKSDW